MPAATMRLDRLLANMGYGSRRDIHTLARLGRVLMDGQPVADADARVALSPDLQTRITVDDEPLDPLPGMAVLLHKPVGVTCSHKESGPLIYDLLPDRWRARDPQLSSIGRLDKDTSGLLLLTDDGALLHRVIAPKSQVAKTYLVTLDRPLSGREGDVFAAGTLMLDGETKPLLPVEMTVVSQTMARVVLHEGRYHQVRRMFAAVGNHVTALHRETVGGLGIPQDLAAGSYRVLTPDDVARIFAA